MILDETGVPPDEVWLQDEGYRLKLAEYESDREFKYVRADIAERDRKDAERYRWLRSFANFFTVDVMLGTTEYNTLDEAVDAAMAKP